MDIQFITTPHGNREGMSFDAGDIDLIDFNGFTPLIHASIEENNDLVEYLLNRGADVNVKPLDEQATALVFACHCGNFSIVKILLDHGAAIDTFDVEGLTPLHRACFLGYPAITKLLLDRGATIVNHPLSPLHLACKNGSIKCAIELLNRGMDVDLQDFRGDTPIDLAIRFGHQSIVNVLLNHRISKLCFKVKAAEGEELDRFKTEQVEKRLCFGIFLIYILFRILYISSSCTIE